MRISVRFFGAARDITDAREIVMDLEEGSTLDRLMEALGERYPSIMGLSDGVLVSVNGKSLPGETLLSDGDQVSVLPTVTGG